MEQNTCSWGCDPLHVPYYNPALACLISQLWRDNNFFCFLSFQDWNFRHFSCVRRCLLIHNTRHVSQSHTHSVFIAQCAMLAFSGMCQSVHKCLVLQSTFSLDVSESLLAHYVLQDELAELDFIWFFIWFFFVWIHVYYLFFVLFSFLDQ